jgi:hypothetical protein
LNVTQPLLRIATSCPLPQGLLGQNYATRIEAAGGLAPYRFSFSGFLPDGLRGNEDGSLAGTPSALGGLSFVVRVTDAANQSTSSVCSVNVGLPRVPQIGISDFPATVAPAATNLAVTVVLAQSYSSPVEGQAVLSIQANTHNSDGVSNEPDPRLRFANGQTVATFTIPAGQTRATLPLVSSGTVASTVIVSVANLRSVGTDLTTYPSPKVFNIAAATPVVTSACYTRTSTGINVQLNGYSTTRELTRTDVTIGSQTFRNDLTGVASDYYGSALSVGAGGTFALAVPQQLDLAPATAVPAVTVNLFNSVGAAGSRALQACQ